MDIPEPTADISYSLLSWQSIDWFTLEKERDVASEREVEGERALSALPRYGS